MTIPPSMGVAKAINFVNADAVTLAKGLRAALDKTLVQRPAK